MTEIKKFIGFEDNKLKDEISSAQSCVKAYNNNLKLRRTYINMVVFMVIWLGFDAFIYDLPKLVEVFVSATAAISIFFYMVLYIYCIPAFRFDFFLDAIGDRELKSVYLEDIKEDVAYIVLNLKDNGKDIQIKSSLDCEIVSGIEEVTLNFNDGCVYVPY